MPLVPYHFIRTDTEWREVASVLSALNPRSTVRWREAGQGHRTGGWGAYRTGCPPQQREEGPRDWRDVR
jgi:hypothetical protein